MKVSLYYFAKSKIDQKRAKIIFFLIRQKNTMSDIKFLMPYLFLEDQKLVMYHSSGQPTEN